MMSSTRLGGDWGPVAGGPIPSGPMATVTRRGRPPAADSAETRARILDVARRKFATLGFESASNRLLAEEAGLTTGAIYHYFDSKLDIYLAVYEDAVDLVFKRFDEAIVDRHTFADQLRATLEAAHDLDGEDPTLAQFLGSSRVDGARDPSLAAALRASPCVDVDRTFFRAMIDLGVRTGEIDAEDRPLISVLLQTIVVGLTDAVSGDRQRHRRAVEAINRLLEGTLVRPPG